MNYNCLQNSSNVRKQVLRTLRCLFYYYLFSFPLNKQCCFDVFISSSIEMRRNEREETNIRRRICHNKTRS